MVTLQRSTLILSICGLILLLSACDSRDSTTGNASADLTGIEHPALQRWLSSCASCHGRDGRGNEAQAAPKLTGLPSWYLGRQLQHFQSGVRGAHPDDSEGQRMAASLAGMSPSELEQIAELVTLLPDQAPQPTLSGRLARGKDYHTNLCSACHGSRGQGNSALQAPSLVALNDWYLVAQYEKFRDGRRGTHPDDRYGAQMHRFAPAVKESAIIQDIAHYVSTLAGQP